VLERVLKSLTFYGSFWKWKNL